VRIPGVNRETYGKGKKKKKVTIRRYRLSPHLLTWGKFRQIGHVGPWLSASPVYQICSCNSLSFHSTLTGTKLNPFRPSQAQSGPLKAHSRPTLPTAYHGLRARRSIRARVSCVVQLWRRYLKPPDVGDSQPPCRETYCLHPAPNRSPVHLLISMHLSSPRPL
jgi:hypothetical protein